LGRTRSCTGAIRSRGPAELERWLRSRKVRAADELAAAAVLAADAQRTRVRGESVAATLMAGLATNVLDLDRQLAALDKLIAERFRSHRHAPIIASMVGIGDLLGAEFLAATGAR
jgi:Pyruvate/2-oxoacid:ferredoxin oxidoreductase gamma subunit